MSPVPVAAGLIGGAATGLMMARIVKAAAARRATIPATMRRGFVETRSEQVATTGRYVGGRFRDHRRRSSKRNLGSGL